MRAHNPVAHNGHVQTQSVQTQMARVRALYRDSAVLFDMPQTATMGELAEILAVIASQHGAPLKIEVAVKANAPGAGVSATRH